MKRAASLETSSQMTKINRALRAADRMWRECGTTRLRCNPATVIKCDRRYELIALRNSMNCARICYSASTCGRKRIRYGSGQVNLWDLLRKNNVHAVSGFLLRFNVAQTPVCSTYVTVIRSARIMLRTYITFTRLFHNVILASIHFVVRPC